MAKKTTKRKTPKKRDYKREYKNYHSKPEQKKRRAQRNASRAKLTKQGRVKKGDKKDVHHVDGNTANKTAKNLRVRSQKFNRSKKKSGK